jgi:hypothetical protein
MLSKYIPCFFALFIPSVANASWEKDLQKAETSTHIYSVGVGESEDLNEALSKAWSSAVVRAVEVNVPQASKISTSSVEKLHDSEWVRRNGMVVTGEMMSGMAEASDEGSPKVEKVGSKWMVHRLAKWQKTTIQAVKEKIGNTSSIPSGVERREVVMKYLMGIKCGTTVEDVQGVLGVADKSSINGYESFSQWSKINVISDPEIVLDIRTPQGTVLKRVCP